MQHSAIGQNDATKHCDCGGSLAYLHELGNADFYRCVECCRGWLHSDWNDSGTYRFDLRPITWQEAKILLARVTGKR